jgi:hypothetical protein
LSRDVAQVRVYLAVDRQAHHCRALAEKLIIGNRSAASSSDRVL